MKRENRYFVLKRTDMAAALTKQEIARLHSLGKKVEAARRKAKKSPLMCVVVESDWPEYEPTWDAIEKRVDAAARTEADAVRAASIATPIPKGFRELVQGEKILRSDHICVNDTWVRRDSKLGREKSWAVGEQYNCYTDGHPAYPGFHHRTIRKTA